MYRHNTQNVKVARCCSKLFNNLCNNIVNIVNIGNAGNIGIISHIVNLCRILA